MRRLKQYFNRSLAVALAAAFIVTDGGHGVAAEGQAPPPVPYAFDTVGDPALTPEQHRQRADAVLRSHPRGEALYKLAEDGKHLAVTDASELLGDLKTKGPANVSAVDPVTWDECAAQQYDTSEERFYWFKNKFNVCRVAQISVDHFELRGGIWVHTGTTTMLVWFKGTAVDGSNVIEYRLKMTNFQQEGFAVGDHPFSVELKCVNADPERISTCADSDTPSEYERQLSEWEQTAGQEITFRKAGVTTAVPDGTYSRELRGYFAVGLIFTSKLPRGDSPLAWLPDLFRCDTASYVRGSKCVFTRVASVLEFSRSNATYGESAKLIGDAQTNITLTKPGLAGKRVAGIPGGAPLHRLYREYDTRNTIRASRRKVPKTCRRFFGQKYTAGIYLGVPTRFECDEYPFATTYENAARVDPNTVYDYAVRAIPASHNGTAGQIYGNWLGADHILDGDPFWIKIVP